MKYLDVKKTTGGESGDHSTVKLKVKIDLRVKSYFVKKLKLFLNAIEEMETE
jgi:hypothetical protein